MQEYEQRVATLRKQFDDNLATLQSTMLSSPPCQPLSPSTLPSGASSGLAVSPACGESATDLGVHIPVREGLPRRRRLKFKQAAPDYPRSQNPDMHEPASCSSHNWSRVSGVSHASQTNADFGPRRSFQVNVARAEIGRTKIYFKYRTITSPGTEPCHSTTCWQKAAGRNLAYCGRDVCAYDAAVACHAELIAALPDKRRRLAEADCDYEAAAPQGDLASWKTRWL